MPLSRTVEKNDGPQSLAGHAVPGAQARSNGTSGQFAAFAEFSGSQVPDTHRSPVLNVTLSGTVP
jgi:hypothetical protein